MKQLSVSAHHNLAPWSLLVRGRRRWEKVYRAMLSIKGQATVNELNVSVIETDNFLTFKEVGLTFNGSMSKNMKKRIEKWLSDLSVRTWRVVYGPTADQFTFRARILSLQPGEIATTLVLKCKNDRR